MVNVLNVGKLLQLELCSKMMFGFVTWRCEIEILEIEVTGDSGVG